MKNMNIHEDFQKKMQEAAELYCRQTFEVPESDFRSLMDTYTRNKRKNTEESLA